MYIKKKKKKRKYIKLLQGAKTHMFDRNNRYELCLHKYIYIWDHVTLLVRKKKINNNKKDQSIINKCIILKILYGNIIIFIFQYQGITHGVNKKTISFIK